MKRKLILLVVTIVFLVGFGAILHSPPSMIDAVTGATPKSKKAAQASAQLEGSYVLGIILSGKKECPCSVSGSMCPKEKAPCAE